MEERNEVDRVDEVMLPGFRFHPTDEELVGFYLKRKIQQKPLSIELIRQLDIYKYDPWDLPKLATTGEKEWYFYCPRDRKYRNSARPNRVTGAGFWKATGTDRPIYSSEGTKCIGLKKSLVFYKGRAAKGVKTDWMMHEYRLPSPTDASLAASKRPVDKNLIPANEAWAICRIFKKSNSMAHRALTHSWVPPLPPPESTDVADVFSSILGGCSQFGPENPSYVAEQTGALTQLGKNGAGLQQQAPAKTYTSFSVNAPYISAEPSESKHSNIQASSGAEAPIPSAGVFMFSPPESHAPISKCPDDVLANSLPQAFPPFGIVGRNSSGSYHIGHQYSHCFNAVDLLLDMNGNRGDDHQDQNMEIFRRNLNASQMNGHQWGAMRTNMTCPFGLSPSFSGHGWRPNLTWDSSPAACPNETSTTTCSINKCYT